MFLEAGPTAMQLQASIFDVWVFRRRNTEVEFLLLRTSMEKATRYFNGGRFWQIPSNLVEDGESITDAISRILDRYGLQPRTIWAGEHAYLIYNRRFAKMQAIGVFAAEVEEAIVRLDTAEHSEFAWLSFEDCLDRVHYRGLKDGLRSVHEYVTGIEEPAKELCLYVAPGR
jgi:ADP-ribose pyrophosphatase YjhB (NUDIX family)